MIRHILIYLSLFFFVSYSSKAQHKVAGQKQAIDYLGVSGPFTFHGLTFNLAWSMPSQNGYYIQEYLPSGQNIDKYTDLIIVDLIKGQGLTVEQSALKKKMWLDERKKSDPVANYKFFENEEKKECLIDLVISDSNAGIVEWDAIRYTEYKEKGKVSGVSTMTVSKRAYGDNVIDFLENLKKEKAQWINQLLELPYPTLKPKK